LWWPFFCFACVSAPWPATSCHGRANTVLQWQHRLSKTTEIFARHPHEASGHPRPPVPRWATLTSSHTAGCLAFFGLQKTTWHGRRVAAPTCGNNNGHKTSRRGDYVECIHLHSKRWRNCSTFPAPPHTCSKNQRNCASEPAARAAPLPPPNIFVSSKT